MEPKRSQGGSLVTNKSVTYSRFNKFFSRLCSSKLLLIYVLKLDLKFLHNEREVDLLYNAGQTA